MSLVTLLLDQAPHYQGHPRNPVFFFSVLSLSSRPAIVPASLPVLTFPMPALPSRMPASLDNLPFDNAFMRELPADPVTANTRRQVRRACYTPVAPTPVKAPVLVAHSREVAELLEISEESCRSKEFLAAFSGNALLPGMQPYACCYGGHQFGNWAGQLGDGRAINLGEIVNGKDERWALQLKGAGPTPYSRTADGLAVLRSSVREFLCSEAMYHLGVPTTRALSLALTGESVMRDMFYDGNPALEPGAVVCRVAPSFTRFGSFQIFTSRGENDVLKKLLDYTIRTDFPELGAPSPDVYAAWFDAVCQRTAAMIVHWMRVGFVHGVMNTDNMSVLGLTIDYGPYGWLENFDPDWTPNTTDEGTRRYRYGQQPQVAMWNLAQLAHAIVPLVNDTDRLQATLDRYLTSFESGWQQMMVEKLGLKAYQKADAKLITDLLETLQAAETDMSIFYRRLGSPEMGDLLRGDTEGEALLEPLRAARYSPDTVPDAAKQSMLEWLALYRQRLDKDEPDAQRRTRMNAVNPLYVMRNYLAQVAIDKAAEGDFSRIADQLEVLRSPYTEQPGKAEYAEKRPEWARHRPGCSMLSCSS
ncbi:MAG: hypothetical protein ACI8W8_002390 [Rhodothermales bacterium]